MADGQQSGSGARGALAALALLGAAGAGAWVGATRIADELESRSAAELRHALQAEGQDWVHIATDGLKVTMSGRAPDEVARFRAYRTSSGVVRPGRITDQMTIERREMLELPEFQLKILRNDKGISLMGLVPSRTDREAIRTRLASGADAANVVDLMNTAAYPPPEGWQDSIDYALAMAALAPRATVEVTPGLVRVTAVTNSDAEKSRLVGELRRAKPEQVTLVTDITAPLPVITPFVLRFVKTDTDTHVEACSADTEAASGEITSAAIAAGAPPTTSCTIGMGAPAESWGKTAAAAIAALGRIGAGEVTITDRKIAVHVPASADPARYAREIESLRGLVGAPFELTASQDVSQKDLGPPSFTASRPAQGDATIAGRVGTEDMRKVVQNLARSRLGPVTGEVALDAALTPDWASRVIAGLEAMGGLDQGELHVTDALIEMSGVSGDPRAADRAIAALANRLGAGAGYSLAIGYDKWRDPGLSLPTGEACIDRLNTVMTQARIGFDPAGSRISGDIGPVIGKLRPIMQDCADYRIEIGGHTDDQGEDASNLTLSLNRAWAVRRAMETAGLPVAHVHAQGYGETRPVDTNDTKEGRDANRRIEFLLLSPQPVAPITTPAPVTGTTPPVDRLPVIDEPQDSHGEHDAAPGGDTAESTETGTGAAQPDTAPPAVTPPQPTDEQFIGPRLPVPTSRPEGLGAAATIDEDQP